MRRGEKLLTALGVQKLSKPGRHADGGGLYLEVDKRGGKRWLLRLQADGRRRDFGLGGLSKVSLQQARERAADYRQMMQSGIDPITEKRRKRQETDSVPKFREAALSYYNENRPTWRNEKHAKQVWATLETRAHPHIGDMRVDEIEERHVRAILIEFWLERPETARRVRQRIASVLDWAKANGYRSSTLDLRTKSLALPRQPKGVQHHIAMAYEDVPGFLAAIRELRASTDVVRSCFEFLVLTAVRSGEVRGATWAEIDTDENIWIIPPERMKAGREHRVPLPPAAVLILDEMRARRSNETDLVFPGAKRGRPISDMAFSMLYRRLEIRVSTHGFRTSFRTWAAECTDFPREVAEAALAHLVADLTERAYQRSDFFQKRRALMDAWAEFCVGCADEFMPLVRGQA